MDGDSERFHLVHPPCLSPIEDFSKTGSLLNWCRSGRLRAKYSRVFSPFQGQTTGAILSFFDFCNSSSLIGLFSPGS